MEFNVLVVDDSAVMRAMVIKTLRLSGLALGEIYQASNGQEGLLVLDNKWIDLLLVDINMPIMNGEEMIDRIRSNPEYANLAIVVVSTESSETRINAYAKKGAGFVHKPFTPETLKQEVMQITGVTDEGQTEEGITQSGGPDF